MTFMPRRVGPGIFGPVGGGWGGTTNSNVTLRQPQSLDIGAASEGEGLQLGLLNALQQVQQAGLQRTASPMGSIAQNLAPIFGAMIYGKILDRQAAAEAAAGQQKAALTQSEIDLNKAQAQKALSGGQENPQNLEGLLVQRILTGKPYDDVVEAMKKTAKPGSSEWAARMDVAGGNPAVALEQKRKEEDDRAKFQAGLMGAASFGLSEQKKNSDEMRRLGGKVSADPQYKGKYLLNKNTLQETPASQVSVAELEAPDSPYKVVSEQDKDTVRSAKRIAQELNRLDELIPELLPESRMGLPITLAQQAVGNKSGGKAAEFDRLAAFEKLTSIRDFIVRNRINETEVKEVGKPDRMTDNQSRAFGKTRAMRDLIRRSLAGMDLNPDVPWMIPQAPKQSGVKVLREIPD